MAAVAEPADELRLPVGLAAVVVLLGALGSSALAALAARPGPPQLLLILTVGAAGLAGLVVLAMKRFVDFLVVLLAIRTVLDYLEPAGDGSWGATDPTSIMGITFLGLGAGWVWTEWRRRALVQPSMLTIALSVLTAIALVNPLFSVSPISSFQSALRIATAAVMFAILEQVFRRDPTQRRRLFRAVAWSAVVPAVVAIQQLRAGRATVVALENELGRIRGTFVHPNPFATYLVLVVVVLLALRATSTGWHRTGLSGAAVGCTVLLLFTYSRAGWAAALLGLVVFGLEQERRILRALLVGAGAALLLVPSFAGRFADLGGGQEVVEGAEANSLAWRYGYWQELIPLGLQQPVGGIGLEGTRLTQPDELAPHNVLVQALVELGLPGFLAVLGAVLAAAGVLYRARRAATDRWERVLGTVALAGAIGFFAQMFTENLLTQVVTLWYLGLLLAAAGANGWHAGEPPEAHRARSFVRRFLDSRGQLRPAGGEVATQDRVVAALGRARVRHLLDARPQARAAAPSEVDPAEVRRRARAALERAQAGARTDESSSSGSPTP